MKHLVKWLNKHLIPHTDPADISVNAFSNEISPIRSILPNLRLCCTAISFINPKHIGLPDFSRSLKTFLFLTTLKKSLSVLEINENQVVRSQKFPVGMTRSQFQGTTNSRILSPVIISSKYSRNGTEKLSAIWNQRLITKQATAYLCTNAWTPLICACVCGPDQEMYEWVWEFKQIKLKWCTYRTQRGETPGDSRTPMIVAEFPLITSNSGNPSITVWLLLSESYFLQFFPKLCLFPGTGCFAKPRWYNLLQGLLGRWTRLRIPGDSHIVCSFPNIRHRLESFERRIWVFKDYKWALWLSSSQKPLDYLKWEIFLSQITRAWHQERATNLRLSPAIRKANWYCYNATRRDQKALAHQKMTLSRPVLLSFACQVCDILSEGRRHQQSGL